MKRASTLVFVLVLAFACDADGDSNGQFVALQRDFDGFGEWDVAWSGAGEKGLAHKAGNRTIRVNDDPASLTAPVPTGTIVVKTIEDAEFGDIVQIHAMSKRGAGYNPDGVQGWEWFELELNDDGHPVIIWRGTHPPDGECYGCPPGTDPAEAAMLGDCNTCHADAPDGLHTIDQWH